MNVKKKLKIEAEKLLQDKNVGNQQIQDLLLSIKMKNGNIHHSLPDDEKVKEELVEDALAYTNLTLPAATVSEDKAPPEKVLFHNRQAFGDILTMTAAVRDFKNKYPNTKVGVSTTAMHI